MFIVIITAFYLTSFLCIFIGVFLQYAKYVLKLNQIFKHLGFFMLFLGLIPLMQMFAYSSFPSTGCKIFMTLMDIFGLSLTFPMPKIINSIRENTVPKQLILVLYSIFSLLIFILLIDLFMNLKLFYSIESTIIILPLHKVVYFPISIIAVCLGGIFVWVAYIPQTKKDQKILRPLVYGITVLLPFNVFSLLEVYDTSSDGLRGLIVLSLGILQFSAFVSYFVIKYIKQHMRYNLYKSQEQKNSKKIDKPVIEENGLYSAIQSLIENEKVFRKKDLTIDYLSKEIGQSKSIISNVIRNHSGKNFKTFINSFRVEDMKRKLTHNKDRSIIDIGLETGFSSRTSINRIFQLHTGMSPMDYRNSQNMEKQTE